MEKCTLESIYDLIISYCIKGYCLQFNKTWLNTHNDCQRRYLCLMQYTNDISICWDDSSIDIPPSWDHEIVIEKWI